MNGSKNRAYQKHLKTFMRLQDQRYPIRSSGGQDSVGSQNTQPCSCCECQKKRELCCKPEPQPVEPSGSDTVERKCTVSFKKPLADEIPFLYPPFRKKEDIDPSPACNSCTAFSPFLCISPKGSVKPKKSQPSCPCRRPKIVVPSGPESRSPSRSQTLLRSGKSSQKVQSKKKERKDRSSSKEAKANKTPPSRPPLPSGTPPPCCPLQPCTTCPTMSEISKELCELQGKLEHLQGEQLGDIRHQVDCLKANMPAISDLSLQLCDLKQKFDVVQNQDLCEIRQLIDCLNGKIHALSQTVADKKECCCPTLVRKPSSTCQFCRGLNLPLLDSFRCQLAEAIGSRCLTEVLMSVYLRADNIYHVNIRDMQTGCSLGCFLVTDCGIEEARKLGVFQQILTFCVIDVRNTLPPKNYPIGITFEFHHPERQCGGSDIPDETKKMEAKSYMARVLGVSTDRMKHMYLTVFKGYDLAAFVREDTF